MAVYRIERMTEKDYDTYMSGALSGYVIRQIMVKADSAEEAIAKTEEEGWVINKNYVRTIQELEQERQLLAETRAKLNQIEEEERARKKAKREEAERKKAESLGLTVKEYRRLKAVKSNITKVKNEIAELEKTLKRKKAYLKKCEEEKNKYE